MPHSMQRAASVVWSQEELRVKDQLHCQREHPLTVQDYKYFALQAIQGCGVRAHCASHPNRLALLPSSGPWLVGQELSCWD